MSKQVTKELKQSIVQRYLNGETVSTIARETQISRSTIYLWIRKSQVSPTKNVQPKDLSRLKMQYERSQRIAQILQTAPCTASAPLREKLDAIVLMSKDYNINILYSLRCTESSQGNILQSHSSQQARKHRICKTKSRIKADY